MNTILWVMLFLCTSALIVEVRFYDNLLVCKTKMSTGITAVGLLDSTINIIVR